MKKVIFGIIILTVLGNSCKKPKGNKECTWELETTNMHNGVCKMLSPTDYKQYKCNNLDSLDTCNYDLLLIDVYFDVKYLPHDMCSTPIDSIIGTIEDITVICNNDYNQNIKKNDTINSILNVVYQEYNKGFIETPISLVSYVNNKPICTGYINLLINQPPDSVTIQSFKVVYKETDGTVFTGTTKSVYIKP